VAGIYEEGVLSLGKNTRGIGRTSVRDNYKMYVVLTGDLKSSRKIKDRAKIQGKLMVEYSI